LNSRNYVFNGAIDEVRFWDVARTASEISGNMNAEIDGATASLRGYWRLNENSGTVANDQTVNSSHLAISGATWGFE
jgi:hypothetical protein